jgi:Fe(3+) dicitrate transport protein
VSYVGDTYTSASNTTGMTNGAGQPDARFGKTDAFLLIDLSLFVRLRDGVKLVGGVHNLGDQRYVVSRHPEGPRNGMPRSFYIGMQAEF